MASLENAPARRIGTTLAGTWTLEALLGVGGAGAVYLGRDASGGGVAIKLLHEELREEPSVRDRFVREAYVANTIDHEGIVRVISDGADENGTPFIVMELLDGETFHDRQLRKGGKLPIGEVLWAADRTLGVLTKAHAKGILHRDIKPENLFLTRDRQLKVLDFGIARLAQSAQRTVEGTILGTLAYMPPEQARGATHEVGVQSDLWSVGATMFTLISGKLVREGDQLGRLLHEAAYAKPLSLRAVAPDAPKEVVDLVDFALSLELNVRWPKAAMMRRAVRMVYEQLAHGDDIPESQAGVVRYNASGPMPPPPVSIAPPPADDSSCDGAPIPTMQAIPPNDPESIGLLKTVLGVGQSEKK
jgi:serine/threonine-protein kinase